VSEALDEVGSVPVTLGGVRGGPDQRTLRADKWWRSPLATATFLTAFVVYSTWAVFQNAYYYVGAASHRDLISPFFSPCIAGSCQPGTTGSFVLHWWTISPGILILGGPLSFRLTCYYYRKAYYRSFWQSPPACGVTDGHPRYTGETRFPLILQNLHRYTWFIALIFAVINIIDAVMAFRFPGAGEIGVSVGTLVLCANALLLTAYTVSCHFCRHICGGNLRRFSRHPVRYRLWKFVTPLNAKHMELAWASLVVVAFADLYVRLVASGVFSDPKIL